MVKYKYIYFFLFILGSIFIFEYATNFSFFSLSLNIYNPPDFSGALKSGIYISSYLFISLNLVLFYLMRRVGLFFLFLMFYSLTFVVDVSYYSLGYVRGFSASEFVTALNESAHALDAMSAFRDGIIKSVVYLTLSLIAVWAVRKLVNIRFFYLPFLFLPFSLVGGNYIMQHTFYRVQNYPSFVKVPLTIFNAYNDGLVSLPYSNRDAVATGPSVKPHYKNIIVFVDESVTGDYLSINGYKQKTTPFLEKLEKQEKLVTLGSVSAVSSRSAQSNYILRNGVTIEELPDKAFSTLKKPSIFQYAKKAGYKTTFLDAQAYGLTNYMSNFDLKHIDVFESLSDHLEKKNDKYHDRMMIERLATIMDPEEYNFIFFVKYGSHFQWQITHPKDQEVFKPALSENEGLSFENRERAVNSYLNSLRWGVDGFVEHVLKKIDMKDTLIVYTSDHGQNIIENGTLVTHGLSENPPSVMANVPLFFYSKNIEYMMEKLQKIETDSYSQYQLFPSLLEIMGYDAKITNKYGPTLWGGLVKERRFYSGNLFGKGYINQYEQ